MGKTTRLPMINDDGEVRELTVDDFAWFVSVPDFGSMEAVQNFLNRRSELLLKAESVGIDRDFFLAIDPNKPGFEDRVAKVIGAIQSVGLIAAA